MLQRLKQYTTDAFNLFYPHICLACEGPLLSNEEVVCYKCENELPETGYWDNTDNKLAQRLGGRVNYEAAMAVYTFHQAAKIQNLLHALKYKKRQDVGVFLGRQIGHRVTQEGSIIKGIDVIVPVPLHPKKEKKRGYNQCNRIAEGLAEVTQLPVATTAVERVEENISQTGKNRFERWENVSGIFAVSNPEQLKGKHILLVDDVVTTGATAESCMHTILSVPGAKVSFAAVAAARD